MPPTRPAPRRAAAHSGPFHSRLPSPSPPPAPRYRLASPRSRQSPNTGRSAGDKAGLSTRVKVLVLGVLFVVLLSGLAAVLLNFPALTEAERAHLKVPATVEDVKALADVLNGYTKDHYVPVLCSVILAYITFIGFCIPGSSLLAFLSGALFGVGPGFAVAVTGCALGSSLAYALAYFLGRPLMFRIMPDKLSYFESLLDNHRRHLFYYFMFLRLSPLLPNWFINISSPVVGVDFSTYLLGTFFGCMPVAFLSVETGIALNDLTTAGLNALGIRMAVVMCVAAALSLLPVALQKWLDRKEQSEQSDPKKSK